MKVGHGSMELRGKKIRQGGIVIGRLCSVTHYFGWHVPELAKGVLDRQAGGRPRPSQTQGRATRLLKLAFYLPRNAGFQFTFDFPDRFGSIKNFGKSIASIGR